MCVSVGLRPGDRRSGIARAAAGREASRCREDKRGYGDPGHGKNYRRLTQRDERASSSDLRLERRRRGFRRRSVPGFAPNHGEIEVLAEPPQVMGRSVVFAPCAVVEERHVVVCECSGVFLEERRWTRR